MNTLSDDFRNRYNDFYIYRLTINCRNIQAVSELSFSLANIQLPYSQFLITSSPVFYSKYYFYTSDEEQASKISSVVKMLTTQGYKSSELVILYKVPESQPLKNSKVNLMLLRYVLVKVLFNMLLFTSLKDWSHQSLF